jgi:hypothetical protein
VFEARSKFLSRLARSGSLASLSAMVLDREELFPRGVGWSRELMNVLDELVDSSEVDFLDPGELAELRVDLIAAVQERTIHKLQGSSSSFILEFFPAGKVPHLFSIFLGNLPFESVRILLVFFADLFPYTYLCTTNQKCPFCSGQLSSKHFFFCQHTPPPYNDWDSMVERFVVEDFWGAVDRIFLTLQRWASICRKFTPGFEEKLVEYFRDTEARATGRNKLDFSR